MSRNSREPDSPPLKCPPSRRVKRSASPDLSRNAKEGSPHYLLQYSLNRLSIYRVHSGGGIGIDFSSSPSHFPHAACTSCPGIGGLGRLSSEVLSISCLFMVHLGRMFCSHRHYTKHPSIPAGENSKHWTIFFLPSSSPLRVRTNRSSSDIWSFVIRISFGFRHSEFGFH